MPPAPLRSRLTRRDAALRGFVARRYGMRGTLALHRHAIGLDLLRAPVNVALAPVALLMQGAGWLLGRIGAGRAGRWLRARRVFLRSDMSTRIEADLTALIADLQAQGLGPDAAPDRIARAIRQHVGIRNAVAEITTSLIVLAAGLVLFHRATPGLFSLAAPVARMRAQDAAARDFPLGETLGRAWYGYVDLDPSWPAVGATFVGLAMAGALFTTFAGLIADPVQRATGIHRRRLSRLIARLEGGTDGTDPEPLLARLGDVVDTVLIAVRSWRG